MFTHFTDLKKDDSPSQASVSWDFLFGSSCIDNLY